MEEFREIEFEGSMLRVYKTGEIWRWMKYHKYWEHRGLNIKSTGYYTIQLNNKIYLLHRLIAMVYLGLDITDKTRKVDHIDRCRTNNNIENLRLVSQQQNNFNTNVKGYYWIKRDKLWQVRITLNANIVYQKRWKNEEDAAADYIKQKEIYHIIPHNDTTQSVLLNSPVSDDLESMDA